MHSSHAITGEVEHDEANHEQDRDCGAHNDPPWQAVSSFHHGMIKTYRRLRVNLY